MIVLLVISNVLICIQDDDGHKYVVQILFASNLVFLICNILAAIVFFILACYVKRFVE
jgi:hypothetical protein